jgi:hypothetical protein
MIIKKFNKTIHIKLESKESNNIYNIIDNNDLFRNDLYVVGSDSWLYLLDANRNEVCFLTDYGYNMLEEIAAGKNIILKYQYNDPGYEFNE